MLRASCFHRKVFSEVLKSEVSGFRQDFQMTEICEKREYISWTAIVPSYGIFRLKY